MFYPSLSLVACAQARYYVLLLGACQKIPDLLSLFPTLCGGPVEPERNNEYRGSITSMAQANF
jgi:hypothetical protein